jgi:hypothetical protein
VAGSCEQCDELSGPGATELVSSSMLLKGLKKAMETLKYLPPESWSCHD